MELGPASRTSGPSSVSGDSAPGPWATPALRHCRGQASFSLTPRGHTGGLVLGLPQHLGFTVAEDEDKAPTQNSWRHLRRPRGIRRSRRFSLRSPCRLSTDTLGVFAGAGSRGREVVPQPVLKEWAQSRRRQARRPWLMLGPGRNEPALTFTVGAGATSGHHGPGTALRPSRPGGLVLHPTQRAHQQARGEAESDGLKAIFLSGSHALTLEGF